MASGPSEASYGKAPSSGMRRSVSRVPAHVAEMARARRSSAMVLTPFLDQLPICHREKGRL